MSRFKLFLTLLCSAPLLSGCMVASLGVGVDHVQWTEEVLQPDGTVVQIERAVRARSSGFPESARGPAFEQRLTYKPLGASWKGDGHSPFTFEFLDGKLYLAVNGQTHAFCKGKAPSTFALRVLTWKDMQWEEVRNIDEVLPRLHKNLMNRFRGKNGGPDAHGFFSLKDKLYWEGRDYLLLSRYLSPLSPFTCGQLPKVGS